jgi:hypothetical protein
MTELERFMSHVQPEPNSGCWLWDGAEGWGGYGKCGFRGGTVGAHRASWELHCGPIPDGLWVLHRCDVRPCVNPGHLFLGTQLDNMQDAASKGRNGMQRHPERSVFGRPGVVKRPGGERNGRAKLTAEQVSVIRRALLDGGKKRCLARAYGISDRTIRRIGIGEIWPIDAALSESRIESAAGSAPGEGGE